MKKLLLLIATIAYFTSVSGAVVYIHNCMGNIVEWSLVAEKNKESDSCGMHEDGRHDCCKDQVKILKVDPELKQVEYPSAKLKVGDILLPFVYLSVLHHKDYPLPTTVWAPRGLPPAAHPGYNILYCQFRI